MDLRTELKRVFVPHVQGLGFVRDRRRAPGDLAFRRERDDATHLLEIRFDKYQRPRFVLDFGLCRGAAVVAHGRTIPCDEARATDCAVRGRLQPGRGTSTRSWFRADPAGLQRILPKRHRPTPGSAVGRLLELLPEVEAFWASGAVGPHLHLSTDDPAVDAAQSLTES